MVSLARMLQSLGQSSQRTQRDELPPIQYPSEAPNTSNNVDTNTDINPPHDNLNNAHNANLNADNSQGQNNNVFAERDNQQLRAKHVVDAVEQVRNAESPTPLTDRYLAYRKTYRHPSRPPFAPASLWQLKHGVVPIMSELIDVVDINTLNSMPIEAVAILDRINGKLKRYREWSDELKGEQAEWVCERQYVIDKLIAESIPEALIHYEQLLRFSPYRTKKNLVNGNMTAGDILTDLFLEIDYELDELHEIVLNKLASTHRYVKSRTQNN